MELSAPSLFFKERDDSRCVAFYMQGFEQG